MTDYPRLRALLAELCGLEGEDEQLPLSILVRLYRHRLRAPFRILPQLGYDGEPRYQAQDRSTRTINRATHMLHALYPRLEYAGLLNDVEELRELHEQVSEDYGYRVLWAHHVIAGEAAVMPQEEKELMHMAMGGEWRAHDMAALLYQLTLADELFPHVLPLLEGALGVDPEVSFTLLELADFTEAQARAMTLVQAAEFATRPRPWHNDTVLC